jgi:predicted phage terminase large subunit-like protein
MTALDVTIARREARALLQARAQENFMTFCHLMARRLVPAGPFSNAPHFQVLARALEKVVTGETPRLLIAIPPRHGKSLFSSIALPAWILGRDPGSRIICASYGQELARGFAQQTRDLLQSPEYQRIFPGTALASGGQALEELRTTANGSRRATSVEGVLTGKGADYVIIDDAMKAVDASSEIARNNVYDWFKIAVMSRFDKPLEARIVVLMQRLHMGDLIGRLKDEEGWTLLEMPGEGVINQSFDLGNGKTWEFKPGDLLFEERFSSAALDQLKADLGETAYSTQILQRPVPAGGALFKLKYFQRYEKLPPYAELVVQSWDTAIVDTATAAYSVCTTWGIQGYKLYLIDVFRKRLEFFQIEKAMLSLKEKYKASFVILETSGAAAAIAGQMRGYHGGWEWLLTIDPKLGKEERAMAQTSRIERKRVYLPISADWLSTFEAEIAQFPSSKYADQVDSMVHFLSAFDSRNKITRRLKAFENWPEIPF